MLGKRRKQKPHVVVGDEIAEYGFGDGHPFGQDRHDVFVRGLKEAGLDSRVVFETPRLASRQELELFHAPRYVQFVEQMSVLGYGFLDEGDTPAFPGIFQHASAVVGATLKAGSLVAEGTVRRAFVPIAGLHHAGREKTSGFCVFNDIGVLVEYLRAEYGLTRIAYVDIDAHHGDGVYYDFAADPDLIFADIHEDGRFLFPGTGAREERGVGPGEGRKLNLPLHPGADDDDFAEAWAEVEAFIDSWAPEFFILQCGADSLAGDPLTHLQFTEASHGLAARRMCELAARHADGRILGLGGGGYNRRNLAVAWSRVVQEFVEAD
jgi:acetoin utilization protein AcuC